MYNKLGLDYENFIFLSKKKERVYIDDFITLKFWKIFYVIGHNSVRNGVDCVVHENILMQ